MLLADQVKRQFAKQLKAPGIKVNTSFAE